MASRSEECERELARTRERMGGILSALRARSTRGQVLRLACDYARDGAPGGYLRSLGRGFGSRPMPVLLMAIGSACAFAAVLAARSVAAAETAEAAREAWQVRPEHRPMRPASEEEARALETVH